MSRIPGRWVGIGIAVLLVGAMAIYVSSAGNTQPAAQATPAQSGLFSAAGSTPTDAPGQNVAAVPGMSAADVAGLLVKIGIVAVILGLCLWLLGRYAGTTSRGGGRTGAVTIADTIVLAQGRALYLIDVGDRALVIGATPQQLSLVAELTDPDVLEKLRTIPARPTLPINGLAGLSGFSNLPSRLSSLMTPHTVAPQQNGREPLPESGHASDRPAARVRPAASSFAEALAAQQPVMPPAQRRSNATTVPSSETLASTNERLAALAERIRSMREPQAL